MKHIPLSQGKYALVDDEDFERLSKYSWCLEKNKHTFYAMRDITKNKKHSTVRMHREVLKLNSDIQVHHINHNGLDNRKINLETYNRMIHSHHQPVKGVSKYKGVSLHRNKWRARINYNGIYHNLGSYDIEEDAARAYNHKAKELYGEYASKNSA